MTPMTGTTNRRPDRDAAAAVPADVVAAIGVTSGESFWRTTAWRERRVPSLVMTDGPHGIRLQREEADHLGVNDSVPATCFPPAVALGCSFDPELLRRVGAALGREARQHGVHVLLGPGINIKRSLLCGRNFEYFSEDPLVSAYAGAAMVEGIQSQGVGASLKHFAANNQETDRLRVSSDVDERPLREIYLRAFEHIVRTARPWTVMAAYNAINAVPACENRWLLTDVLRGEWGFDGVVVSDWGAVQDRVAALVAGLDLEMPGNGGTSDREVERAVADGDLDVAHVWSAAERLAVLANRVTGPAGTAPVDVDAHHRLAREAAAASVVLLRNEDGVLPLNPSTSIAVIGELARTPRYQGAGSSHVVPTKLDSLLDELSRVMDTVEFAPGYAVDEGAATSSLVEEAIEVARRADTVVLALGLPPSYESEGFDRESIALPQDQLDLVDRVVAVAERVVVVLANGGVVDLGPVAERVAAIVEGWLPGQAGGSALADVLTGAVNPSGRLTETIPLRIEDSPAYLDFPGEHSHVRYSEGLHVGYRWYDARRIPVRYPFGHGLSYTTFAYGRARAEATAEGAVVVRCPITNTGDRAGAEVVQAYVSVPGSTIVRAPRELKGFAKIPLESGETREAVITIPQEWLATWHPVVGRWVVEPGRYVVSVGASSADLREEVDIRIAGEVVAPEPGPDSSLGELLEHPRTADALIRAIGPDSGLAQMLGEPQLRKMLSSFPIGRLPSFPGIGLERPALPELLEALRAAVRDG